MIKRVELVIVPTRGKKRVYAMSPLTVGPERWRSVQRIYAAIEQEMREVERRLRNIRHIRIKGLK